MKLNHVKMFVRSGMLVAVLAIAGYVALAPAPAHADARSGGAKCQIVGDGGPMLCCKAADKANIAE
jgi:hypothetical protein